MILGVDIGGTAIKFGLVSEDGQLHKKCRIDTPVGQGVEAIIEAIVTKVNALKSEWDFERIGMGTPGTVDYKTGIAIRASNLPYDNTPLGPMLDAGIGQHAYLYNDATCAVAAELYGGLGKEYKNIIMVTLGTGVGGGIIIDGKIYHGKQGGAGEIGHMTVDQDGIMCRCGQRGCYEMYASVSALIAQTRAAAQAQPDSLLAELCRDGIHGETVFEAVKGGCPTAKQVLEKYIAYVAAGITSLYRIFQPDVVVLGGAVSNQEELLLKPLREAMIWPVTIVTSELKNDAGVIGAALLAQRENGAQ